MKVNIKLFDNYKIINFYRDHMNKKYGLLWPEKQTKFDTFIEKLDDCCQWLLNISYNKIVRKDTKVKVKFKYVDLYSLDYTLSLIILPLLKEFNGKKQGIPMVDNNDLPEDLKLSDAILDVVYNGKECESDIRKTYEERAQMAYNYIIDKMIWSFERISKGEDFYPEWENDFNPELQKDYDKKIQEGLNLFGKYYRTLWL